MRQLLLVGALLCTASSPARDARTSFQVGASVVASCEVSTVVTPREARCAPAASRELRHSLSSLPGSRAAGPSRGESIRGAPQPATSSGDAAAPATRILLIRF